MLNQSKVNTKNNQNTEVLLTPSSTISIVNLELVFFNSECRFSLKKYVKSFDQSSYRFFKLFFCFLVKTQPGFYTQPVLSFNFNWSATVQLEQCLSRPEKKHGMKKEKRRYSNRKK